MIHVQVVNNEVCAIYYEQRRVDAEIKTVTAKFEKVCKDESVRIQYCSYLNSFSFHSQICIAPPPAAAYGYQAQAECAKEYRHVCYKEPVLVPLVKKVKTQYHLKNYSNFQTTMQSYVCKSLNDTT